MSGQGGLDHGRGTTHPGLHFDRTRLAIQLAGTAFNTGTAIDQVSHLITRGKYTLGTNHEAHSAIGAQFWIVEQGIGSGDGFHFYLPNPNKLKMSRIIPLPAMTAITGT